MYETLQADEETHTLDTGIHLDEQVINPVITLEEKEVSPKEVRLDQDSVGFNTKLELHVTLPPDAPSPKQYQGSAHGRF